MSGMTYCLPPFPRCLLRPRASHTRGEASGGGERNKVLVAGVLVAGISVAAASAFGNWGVNRAPPPKLGSWCLDSSHLFSDPFSVSGSAWPPPPRAQPSARPEHTLPDKSPRRRHFRHQHPMLHGYLSPSAPCPHPAPVAQVWTTGSPHSCPSCQAALMRDAEGGGGLAFSRPLLSLPPFFLSPSHPFGVNIRKKTPICCRTQVPPDGSEGLSITNTFKWQKCFDCCFL